MRMDRPDLMFQRTHGARRKAIEYVTFAGSADWNTRLVYRSSLGWSDIFVTMMSFTLSRCLIFQSLLVHSPVAYEVCRSSSIRRECSSRGHFRAIVGKNAPLICLSKSRTLWVPQVRDMP